MPDEFVLEAPTDLPSGMPTGSLPPDPDPAPPPEPPPPGDEPEPPLDDLPAEEPRRGGVIGDLVEERAARRAAEQQAQSATELLRQVIATPEGLAILQRAANGEDPGASAEQQALLQEAEATAVDLGLYDANGQPDLAAAQRIMAREERRVQAQVQKAVQHLQQTELLPIKQQRAEQTIAHVKSVAAHYGIDPDMVERGMRTLPLEQMSNPEVQQTVLMTALGLQTFGAGGQPPQAPQAPAGRTTPQARGALRPPIYQEAAGGRPRSAPVLDEPFRARLRESGLKDTDINASLDRFVPGAPNRLE